MVLVLIVNTRRSLEEKWSVNVTCPVPTKQQLKYRVARRPLSTDDELLCKMREFFKSEEDQVNLMSRCLISTRPTHKEIIKNIRLEEQKLKIEHNIMSWFMHYGQKCNCFYCRKELRDKIEWISWR